MGNNTEDQLTLFAADSPAKISQLQESKKASKRAPVAASGQNAPAYLGKFDQSTQSLKTSQRCCLETTGDGFSEFSGTFPRSGMMQSGTVYRLHTLARLTGEIESGLLPTPNASDHRDRGNLNHPSIKRRIALGKQIGLTVLFKKDACPMCVEGMMGYPIGHTDLNN